jgi:hypothetical protein
VTGTTYSLSRILARVRLSHPDERLGSQARVRPTWGMGMHSPSTVCGTHAGVDVMIGWDAASVLRNRGQNHVEATSVTHVS